MTVLQHKLAAFIMECQLYLKEQLKNYGYLYIGNWQNEVSLSFQGTQLSVFCQ